MPMEEKDKEMSAEVPGAGSSLEQRLAALEAHMSKMMAAYPASEASEQSDIVPGGQVDTVPLDKKQVPQEVVVAAEMPEAIKTQKDEEDEKKKMLQEISNKYHNHLAVELATRLNKSSKEFASKSVKELESMVEVARMMPITKKPEVAQHAGLVTSAKKVEGFKQMSAMERADKFGFAKALELAYKMDTGEIQE